MKAIIYRARRGLLGRTQYRCRILAANGLTTFVSAEGYNNRADLEDAVYKLNPRLTVVYQ